MTDDFSRRDIEFHRKTAASYDDEVTRTYAVYHRYMLDPYLDHVAKQTGSGRALDLGCGTGVISLALARRGFAVVGVDHSEDMLALARAKLGHAAASGSCQFVVADVRSLPAGDDEFDCVTCQGLLHHLAELEGCLRELERVLRPGGFFYISEPSNEETPLKRVFSRLWRLKRMGRRPAIPEGPESVEAPISAKELASLLTRLGFQFEMEFLTHMRPLRSALDERLYLILVRAVSRPWRRKRGDLLFVFGQKPLRPRASRPG